MSIPIPHLIDNSQHKKTSLFPPRNKIRHFYFPHATNAFYRCDYRQKKSFPRE